MRDVINGVLREFGIDTKLFSASEVPMQLSLNERIEQDKVALAKELDEYEHLPACGEDLVVEVGSRVFEFAARSCCWLSRDARNDLSR